MKIEAPIILSKQRAIGELWQERYSILLKNMIKINGNFLINKILMKNKKLKSKHVLLY